MSTSLLTQGDIPALEKHRFTLNTDMGKMYFKLKPLLLFQFRKCYGKFTTLVRYILQFMSSFLIGGERALLALERNPIPQIYHWIRSPLRLIYPKYIHIIHRILLAAGQQKDCAYLMYASNICATFTYSMQSIHHIGILLVATTARAIIS